MAEILSIGYSLMARLPDGNFEFGTAPLYGLLVDRNTWTPDFASDFFIADIIGFGAVELTDGSYARVLIDSPFTGVDSGAKANYCSGAFLWGSVTGAEDYDTAIMSYGNGSDATNEFLIAWDLGPQTTDGSPILLDGTGLPPILQLTANY